MSELEHQQYLWMMGEFGWIAQTALIQHQRGYPSRIAWSKFERIQVGMLQNEIARVWWENGESAFSTEFVSYIDNIRGARANWRPQLATRKEI